MLMAGGFRVEAVKAREYSHEASAGKPAAKAL
jgi:hypothetical protein